MLKKKNKTGNESVKVIPLGGLEQMSDSDFSARAFAWRGRNVIKRNLMIKYGQESHPED